MDYLDLASDKLSFHFIMKYGMHSMCILRCPWYEHESLRKYASLFSHNRAFHTNLSGDCFVFQHVSIHSYSWSSIIINLPSILKVYVIVYFLEGKRLFCVIFRFSVEHFSNKFFVLFLTESRNKAAREERILAYLLAACAWESIS